MCVGAVGQGLWRASLQEGSWALVISKETPPRETTWSGQVAPGEGTMMVSWPADSLLREMLRDEVSRPTQRLRGACRGRPAPAAVMRHRPGHSSASGPSGLSWSQVGGGRPGGAQTVSWHPLLSQAAHPRRQGLDVR